MPLTPNQREALKLVAEGRFYPTLAKEEDGWYARWRPIGIDGDSGVGGWVDEYVREAAVTRLSEDAEDQRHETLHDAWLMALKSRTGRVVWDESECLAFAAELDAWSGHAAEDVAARKSVVFRFAAQGAESPFLLTCELPKGRRPLRALGQATYVCGILRGLRRQDPPVGHTARSGRVRLSLPIDHVAAESFVKQGARELAEAGYTVEGVDLTVAVTASAEIATPENSAADEAARPRLKLTVQVAGEEVRAEELRFLLDQGSSLVYFRDRWVEIDRAMLREALRALEKTAARAGGNPLAFALGIGHVGRLELDEVKTHGWLRGLVNDLRRHADPLLEPVGRVVGLKGELRDYQARGVAWIRFLTEHGFGALLADEMGLGKTIQTIAWLLAEAASPADGRPVFPALVVAPLTLLSNWRHELANFAPRLKVYLHQGDGRVSGGGFVRAAESADITLTSYNLLVRDYRGFADVAWGTLVLDEAQAIKNPDTQVARAVCALTPRRRLALTGTPIENSVADLWSVEEFLNPGFLGERKSFVERFVRPLAADPNSSAGKRLRHALEPFVLRRLKSEPGIAAELGEKREIREYCALTPDQRRDYEAALADFRACEHAQGDVFALLTQLKLVCDGAGKLDRLCDLLETIFAGGESALVFTQYVKVGAWLQTELERRFERRFPFLHGSQDVSAREREIARFNRRGPVAFILSLRAGGFGLNLTKATHVIHFDRWWNPAVESQATDRAHRIGQAKTVFVHLFITEGTLEEHVDDILRRKAAVADTVITSAEWLEAVKLDEQA